MKRLFVFILCAAMFFCVMSGGCGSEKTNGSKANNKTEAPDNTIDMGSVGDNLGAPESGAALNDDVPEYDFNQAEFIVASVDNPNFNKVHIVHEEIGEILNDSKYKRTLYIEERFNVKLIEFFVDDGSVTSRFSKDVRNCYKIS